METNFILDPANIAGLTLDPWHLYKESLLDQNKDYPDPEPILNIIQDGKTIPLLTKKSFSLWQGKAKSKKSTLLAMCAASLLNSNHFNDELSLKGVSNGTILYFDTEQGTSYAARSMQLILKIAGLKTSERLKYSDLRSLNTAQRMEVIKAAIEGEKNVCLVIIDGVVDLITDFMDPRESLFVIGDLLALCSKYDIHVAGVLHQNKKDLNARGHAGTIAGQKCEIEISATVDPKDKSISIIQCEKNRGVGFEDFAISWQKDKLPELIKLTSSSTDGNGRKKHILLPGEIGRETHMNILKKLFNRVPNPKYSEFVLGLKNSVESWYGYHVGESKIKSYIQYYLTEGLVNKSGRTPHTTYQLN